MPASTVEDIRIEAGDDRFWQDLQALIFDEARLANAPEECRRAAALLGIRTPSRILDIGCGLGRHANHLAGLGHHVEGVDKIAYLVGCARAADSGPGQALFHVGDVADYDGYACNGFDYAICFYHSLGFNAEPEDDRRILDRVARLLRPGGRLFIELIDPDGFEPGQVLRFETPLGQCTYDEEIRISADRRRYDLTITERGAPERVYHAGHRLFSRALIADMLRSAGFSVSWPDPASLTAYAGGSRKFSVIGEKLPD